jgi:RNA polymerase sigma-70 factor (ECF subfamily)
MARPEDQSSRWIAQARGGSNEALGRLFDSCRCYLLLVASEELDPGLGAKGGASDLVQETFLEAQRDFGRFTGTSEPELLAWLRQRLRYKVSKFVRGYRGTGKRASSREVPLAEDGSSSAAGPVLVDPQPSPSDDVIADERSRRIEAALGRLPDDYRRVIQLRYRENLSFEEIGRAMGRSPNSARKLWGRAIERLERDLRGMS